MKLPEHVICDLMHKCSRDVTAAIMRTLSLIPREQQMPVAIAAGAGAIGILSAILDTDRKPELDPECVLLGALLCARCSLAPGGEGISQAYADLETLKAKTSASA
jgi:hypothetical protein